MKRIITITFILIILLISISCKKNETIYSLSFDLDGGSVEGDLPTEFKLSDNYSLPNASKEDNLFVGWIDIDNEKDNYVVNKLEAKNYNLKAWFIDRFEFNDIGENDLFNQKEDNYYVYVHRDGCTWCNKIKDGVLAYLYKSSLPQFVESRKVYTLNLTKGGQRASILRTYDGENGDGDGSFKVNGLSSIDEMYISSTPTLVEIKTIDGIKKAFFIETGATKVLNEINKGLYSTETFDNKQYTICLNTNGGIVEGSNIIYFYNNDIVNLPKPKKDGYIFIGWTDGTGIIEKIESKDYDLSAIWIPNDEYKTIKEDEIFSQNEESYFVYFYRDGCSWCEKISERVKAYIYKTSLPNYNSSKKVFVLNLTEGGSRASIFRSNKSDEGDGDYYVTGLKDISLMCIPTTPTLIEIKHENGEAVAKMIAHGSTTVIEAIENELVYKEYKDDTNKSYTIEYDLDGGELASEPVTVFYSWQTVTLPIPYKNGYTFIGWYENDELVTNINAKNYNLKAKYVKDYLPSEVTVDDLYKLEYDKYYVCIIKDDLSYLDELTSLLTLFSETMDEPIFVLDLGKDENKQIKRSYTGDNGQSETGRFFVDGVKSIDDLYIPKASALILLEKKDELQVSTYLSSGEEVIQYIKTLLNR